MLLKVQLDEIACKETCQFALCVLILHAFRPLASDKQVVRRELHLLSGWGHVAGCRMSVEEQIEKHARYLARLTEECEGALDKYRKAVEDGVPEVVQKAAEGLWEASMQQRSLALDEAKLPKFALKPQVLLTMRYRHLDALKYIPLPPCQIVSKDLGEGVQELDAICATTGAPLWNHHRKSSTGC